MHVAEWTASETAYDQVGVYDQDAVNGFSEHTLNTLLDMVNPAQASHLLDAMAGNGNLTVRLYTYCERHGIVCPTITLLELSRRQCALARRQLAGTPAHVVWGDVLTMEDYESDVAISAGCFDRVIIKSGSHEIPLAKQRDLYRQIFHVLQPGGLFVNLGFLFDDGEERDQFRELTRFKDQLAGLESAVHNRHFLTREEFYTRLQQAGFVDIRCGMHVSYTIRMLVGRLGLFPVASLGACACRNPGAAGESSAAASEGTYPISGRQQHHDLPRRDYHRPPSWMRYAQAHPGETLADAGHPGSPWSCIGGRPRTNPGRTSGHLPVCGAGALRHALQEAVEHSYHESNHQGTGHVLLCPSSSARGEVQIRCSVVSGSAGPSHTTSATPHAFCDAMRRGVEG
jgi:SAM-dependent methyltransferase